MIEVTVLPEKGADIFALVDLASGLDPSSKAPGGSRRQARRRGPAAAATRSW